MLLDSIADILLHDDKRDRDLRARIGFQHVPSLHRLVCASFPKRTGCAWMGLVVWPASCTTR
jgi:hypothetical protein